MKVKRLLRRSVAQGVFHDEDLGFLQRVVRTLAEELVHEEQPQHGKTDHHRPADHDEPAPHRAEQTTLPFVPGAVSSIERETGFRQGIARYPEIELAAVQYTQSDVATAMAVTEDILTAHGELAGIFAANEAGAIGASQALLSTLTST